MSVISNRGRHIADKLFYWILILLVLLIGGLGSIEVHRHLNLLAKSAEKRAVFTVDYLQQVLGKPAYKLDAKKIRTIIEGAAGEELRVVELYDKDNERVYIYERTSNNITYDLKLERELFYNEKQTGKIVAYFSIKGIVQSLRISEFLHVVIIISLAGLFLGAGIYLLAKKIIISPINATVSFAEEITNGNFGKRINVTSDDEMAVLQRSLNKMANVLQDSLENLKTSFHEAETEHQRALEASRLKSEFLAHMSHEIRTPINAIIGFADILLEGEANSERREHLKTIKKSANILLDNINDILDFSKLEAGKIRISRSELALKDLVDEVTPIVKLRLHGKDVMFTCRISDELNYPVVCDKIRLRQVLLNVLTNSAKFTHTGSINLAISLDGSSSILFGVEDTGIGIPKEYHAHLFEPFTQADGSISREYGGTGLGLAIAKRLVEMMGGRIWIESEVEKGTAIYFTVAAG